MPASAGDCEGKLVVQLRVLLWAGLAAGAAGLANAASAAATAEAATVVVPPGPAPLVAHSSEPTASAWHQRYDGYFRKHWGVEVLGVRAVSSGWLLEFRYRILESSKAAVLNEKRSKAFVIDEATDVRLSVPAMENIGELRQTPAPAEGRIYYILFGNPGRLVKPGGKVDVLVGAFRADGVIVD
ncbi:MAG: hypothetical protein KGI67_11615 [Pseudomonadota bacterium]|nr:hypothetical protein [Pseudomonadota bacterium]